jgi:hypothetical protein
VHFQQVPNPAFTGSGAGFSSSPSSQGASQPAYVQGDIQSVTALIPRASVELVSFGIDNGRVHLVLLPAKTGQAAHGAQSPTLGISFNDFLAWMMRERGIASSGQGQPAAQPTVAAGAGQPASASPTKSSAQPTRLVPSQPGLHQHLQSPFNRTRRQRIYRQLLCGIVLLVLLVVIVRFVATTRDDTLV